MSSGSPCRSLPSPGVPPQGPTLIRPSTLWAAGLLPSGEPPAPADQPESAASLDFPSLLSAAGPPHSPSPRARGCPQILSCPGGQLLCGSPALPAPSQWTGNSCPTQPQRSARAAAHTQTHSSADVPEPECFPRWTQARPCSQSKGQPQLGSASPGQPQPRGSQAPPTHLQSPRPSSETSLYECSSPSCEALPTRLLRYSPPHTKCLSPHSPAPSPPPPSAAASQRRQTVSALLLTITRTVKALSCQRAFKKHKAYKMAKMVTFMVCVQFKF